MDSSKWKKIFYIVAIISMLLSIKSKVFATDVITDNTYKVLSYNQNITLPDEFKDNYWFCSISNNTSGFAGFSLRIFYCDKRFNANYVNGSYIISSLENAKIRAYSTSGPSRSLSSIQDYVNSLSFDLSNVTATTVTNIPLLSSYENYGGVLASNFTITNDNGAIVINKTNENIINPYFSTSTADIEALSFDNIMIETGTYNTSNPLYLKVLEVTNKVEDTQNPANNIYYFNDLTFTLDNTSKYYKQLLDTSIYYYTIPKSALKLKKDTSYYFLLTDEASQYSNYQGELTTNEHIFDLVLVDSADLITTQEEILNSLINNNPSDNTNNIINNGLPRPDYTDENINIPGMNVNIPNDPTTSTFNWIFNYIYSILNSITETSQSVVLEFTPPGYNSTGSLFSFNLSGDLLSSQLENYPIILNLIHSTYWFVICYFIVNDIRKYVEKVKNGDIMTHTDTNIKADML